MCVSLVAQKQPMRPERGRRKPWLLSNPEQQSQAHLSPNSPLPSEPREAGLYADSPLCALEHTQTHTEKAQPLTEKRSARAISADLSLTAEKAEMKKWWTIKAGRFFFLSSLLSGRVLVLVVLLRTNPRSLLHNNIWKCETLNLLENVETTEVYWLLI